MVSFDSFFDKYGHFSGYQVLVSVCIFILGGWLVPSVSVNYTAAPMKHWCDLSRVPVANYSKDQLKDLYIPRDANGDYESCRMYEYTKNTTDGEFNTTRSNLVPCSKWEYDRSVFISTIISKYDLVCEREWLAALSSSLMVGGITIGGLSSGFFSDRFGRLRMLVIFLIFQAGGGLGSAWAPNYTSFAVMRVIVGIGCGATWLCGLVLMVEEVGPRWRSFVAVGMNFSYSLGFILMSGVAYLIRTTEYFQLALALPSVAYFLYWWLLAESPRWLIVMKKYSKAKKAMACLFRKKYSAELKQVDYSTICIPTKRKANWTSLFRTRRVAAAVLIVHYIWVAVSLVWYSLSLNSSALPGDIFLVTFLLAVVEIPAGVTCMVLCRWKVTGRKYTCLGSLIAAGTCGFGCVPLLQYGYLSAVTAVSLVGKFFISMAWSALYVLATELYPTDVRNSATSSSAFCAYSCGIIGSFVGGPMGKLWPPMPYIIYGFMGISAAVLCSFLPETLGKHLCETVEEVEKYGFVKDKHMIIEEDVKLDSNKEGDEYTA